MVSRFSHLMVVGIEGRRQRGVVVHSFRGVLIEWQYPLKVAGSAEQWCMVSRFSHLMAVGIEGRRQRGVVVHGF
jgi:hypothetical protein